MLMRKKLLSKTKIQQNKDWNELHDTLDILARFEGLRLKSNRTRIETLILKILSEKAKKSKTKIQQNKDWNIQMRAEYVQRAIIV